MRHLRTTIALCLASALAAVAAPRVASCDSERSVRPGKRAEVAADLAASDLGALLLVGVRGDSVREGDDVFRLVCELRIGGILLFERADGRGDATPNVRSAASLARFTAELQDVARRCGNAPLLIAADVEGGAVNRLKPAYGFPVVPSHATLAHTGGPETTLAQARAVSTTLTSVGINWNLAPVVDLNLNAASPAIGRWGRSFSDDPAIVTAHARAFVAGLHEGGVLHSLKHFPGLGSSVADPHVKITDVTETARPELELLPFAALVAEGRVDAITTAHVVNRNLDPDLPATLSAKIIAELLRGRLGYDGLVLSEDMLMAAILDHYALEDASALAIGAGVDMLTLSHDRLHDGSSAAHRVADALARAVAAGDLPLERIESARRRVRELRRRIAVAPGFDDTRAASPEVAP